MKKIVLAVWLVCNSGLLIAEEMPVVDNQTSAQPDAVATELAPVYIRAAKEVDGYAVKKAISATKTDTSLMETPMSVQVVPEQVLRDRAVTRTNQLLENVSGVHAESNYGGNAATFFNIRGFSTSNGLRDGFRNYGYIAYRDTQNIQQVEVLKGPAGALYGGLGALGGQINTVSKRPLAERSGEASLLVGRFGQYRTTFDVNTGEQSGFAMRLNGAVEQNATFRDNGDYDSYSISPALSWQSEDNKLTLLTEFNHLNRDGFDFGIPNLPDYRQYSRTRYFGLRSGVYSDVAGDYGRNNTQAITAIFDHHLNADWLLRVAANYSHATQRSTQTFPDNYLYAGGSPLQFTSYINANEWSSDKALQVEVHGKVNTGSLSHQLLVGIEKSQVKHGSDNSSTISYDVDLFNPTLITPHTAINVGSGKNEGRGTDTGLYLQDQIGLTSTVKLLAGVRYDDFHNEAESSGSQVSANQSALSSQVGAVWDIGSDTALFARYGRSHLPNITHSVSASVYDAEIGTIKEVGIKRGFLDKRLRGTLAIYDMTRSNILVADPLDTTKQVLIGRQRSRGLEADLSGELATGWQWIASYAYNKAEVEQDTNVPIGDTLSNAPRHSASLWTTYALSGDWRGFGLGGGVYAIGSREANLPNTYRLSGYARLDAMAYYDADKWRAQLNLTNLLDKQYYTGGEAGVFNYTLDPSPPRSAQLMLTYRF
jgi:iron complex outermembrane receptor protein